MWRMRQVHGVTVHTDGVACCDGALARGGPARHRSGGRRARGAHGRLRADPLRGCPHGSRGRRARGMAWHRRGRRATDGRGPGVAVRQPPGGSRGGHRAQHRTRVVRGGAGGGGRVQRRVAGGRGARHVVDTARRRRASSCSTSGRSPAINSQAAGCPARPHPPRRAVHRDARARAPLVPHRRGAGRPDGRRDSSCGVGTRSLGTEALGAKVAQPSVAIVEVEPRRRGARGLAPRARAGWSRDADGPWRQRRRYGRPGAAGAGACVTGAGGLPSAMSMAWFERPSATLFCSRRTCSNVTRSSLARRRRASACRACSPACLTLYSPRICLMTSSESIRTRTL